MKWGLALVSPPARILKSYIESVGVARDSKRVWRVEVAELATIDRPARAMRSSNASV